jgi:hypothetical protein
MEQIVDELSQGDDGGNGGGPGGRLGRLIYEKNTLGWRNFRHCPIELGG